MLVNTGGELEEQTIVLRFWKPERYETDSHLVPHLQRRRKNQNKNFSIREI